MGLSFILALKEDEDIGEGSLAFTFIIQNQTHDTGHRFFSQDFHTMERDKIMSDSTNCVILHDNS